MADLEYKDPLLQQLYDEEMLTSAQAEEIVDEHERTGRSVRELLVDMDVLSEDALLEIVAQQLGSRVISLHSVSLPTDVIRSIPASVARMYNVIPVSADAQSVELATSELLSPEVIDELHFVLSRDVTFVAAREAEIRAALEENYGDDSDSVTEMLSALESELDSVGEHIAAAGDNVIELENAANQAPVVRYVNLILYQAVKDKASDVHFEPFETEFKIRYRVDGALYEMSPPPKHLALPVTSRIKVISGLNIAERRLPQDGRIQLQIAGKQIDFRVSTLPTQFGESVVIRVLDRSVVSLDLENIGMPDDIYNNFGEDIAKPNGIVVVTGPTGSGKTTTLYSALRRLNTEENKLLTAEDPVEYDIDGIVQIPTNEAIGLTFGRTLRAFLRQDPDIIMVGEIRDKDTAEIAIQSSLTGHLVFSTLHTNDAPGAITRLIDMGVEPFLIASTMEAVLGQRLVRTICPNCKTPYEPEDDMLQMLGLSRSDVGGRPFYFGKGCLQCNETGYKGRRGIYEYLRISDPIRELINERKPTIVIRDKAIELGMRTLREDGIRCILDGSTTVEEVLKYT
ncbi:MAG: type II secretion system ATPase GspE [Verrucomicrobia bacterium]|nr:type II secretion system ATPase GspE [Kiritimatiellia bacterium]MCP5489192.1 type II secretion system ATPase GspE [Verrucomicrobiota bacterium]